VSFGPVQVGTTARSVQPVSAGEHRFHSLHGRIREPASYATTGPTARLIRGALGRRGEVAPRFMDVASMAGRGAMAHNRRHEPH
jgi:hypothetical protein